MKKLPTVKQLTLCFWLLILSSPSFGQDYIEYHRTFHRIDEDVLARNYPLAIDRLDSIYANYDFIYAKHCFKALQICITANDSIKADKWLTKSFQQGIPLWMIRTFPGRAVRYLPAPPQIRTSGFPAYGSSIYGFAPIRQ
jgi:hypothetical protein